jgi:hypothetical protein
VRLLQKHRGALDGVAAALMEKETLVREQLQELFADVEPESRASEHVGAVRAVQAVAPGGFRIGGHRFTT